MHIYVAFHRQNINKPSFQLSIFSNHWPSQYSGVKCNIWQCNQLMQYGWGLQTHPLLINNDLHTNALCISYRCAYISFKYDSGLIPYLQCTY